MARHFTLLQQNRNNIRKGNDAYASNKRRLTNSLKTVSVVENITLKSQKPIGDR